MNRYGITVNNTPERVIKAASARVATGKAMRAFKESDFKPCATVKVRFIGSVAARYDIDADVPFDYGDGGKGTSRVTVYKCADDKETAVAQAAFLREQHEDWNFVRVVKRDAE